MTPSRLRSPGARTSAAPVPAGAARLREELSLRSKRLAEQLDGLQSFWWERARLDDWIGDFSRGGWPGGAGYGYPADRRGDKTHAPLPFLTEPEYFAHLAMSRDLCARNHFAVGFKAHLRAFVGAVSVSFAMRGAAPGPAAAGPVDADGNGEADVPRQVHLATECWEEFAEENDWGQGEGDREEEAVERLLFEGECSLRLFRGARGAVPQVRFLDPEFVRTPPGASALDPRRWGVENPPGDAETAVRLWVNEDPDDPTDCVPVEADRFVRVKGNVPRSVKRGLSDFFPTAESLRKTAELMDNVAYVARLQAAVAWWEQFPTATQAQIQAMVEQLRSPIPGAGVAVNLTPTQSPFPVYSREHYHPGSVIRTEGGRSVLPGPASQPEGFLAVEQAVLKSVAFSYGLPASFTGEGADSFASALVAGSPFVKIIGGRQKRQRGFTRSLVLRVLALCEESGRLPAGTAAAVKPVLASEPVVIADAEKQARTFLSLLAAGCADPVKYMKEQGDEPKVLYANLAAHREKMAQTGGAPGALPQKPGPRDPTSTPPGSAGGDGSSPNRALPDEPAGAAGADETGAQEAATREALGSLGIADLSESVSEARREGEVWQGQSGHWFTLKGGHVVPAKAPSGGSGASPARPPALPAAHLDELARRVKGEEGMVILKTPAGTAHKIRSGSDLREFLLDGGRLPSRHDGAAAKAAADPKAKEVLARADEWADRMAAKHAETVATRLHVSPEQARKMLGDAIRQIARAAVTGGGSDTGKIYDRYGNAVKIGVKYRAKESRDDDTNRALPESVVAEARREGEVWQGPSGHWFTLKDGHTVPAKAPGGAEPAPEAPKAAPEESTAADALHDAAPEAERGRFAKARAGLAARLEKTAGGRAVLAMGRGGVWLFHQIEHRLLYAAKKTQEVAVAAAKERGLDPERVEKLKRALYVADFLGGYVTGGAALAVAGPYAGKAAAVMPSASVAYLAYSTAKNPAAVWRAARAVVRATFAKGTPAETPA